MNEVRSKKKPTTRARVYIQPLNVKHCNPATSNRLLVTSTRAKEEASEILFYHGQNWYFKAFKKV